LKTEQAHSLLLGREALPPWLDPQTARRALPAIWLNLVCLDAPIVALVWLWLFAGAFHRPVHPANAVALFLTAWLIYLADRLVDAASLRVGTPRSLRQDFCLNHREMWISALLLIAGFDLYVVWRSVPAGTFLAGAVVGILALVYLALNYPRGRIWRSLPAKEVAIGLLFTAGTLVALLPAAPPVGAPFIAGGLAFACLCSLNCISIAAWERDLDRAQGKVSVATCHPGFARHVGKICTGLALASFAMAIAHPSVRSIFACISVSALLLGWLHASADIKEGRFLKRRSLGINRDQHTALADLVLLTPIIPLMMAL
jgi:hypothetical protein